MSCRIENGRAILPNGKDSKLFESLKEYGGHQANAIYESIYSKEFKDFYGFDFEKEDITQMERAVNNLDENNEPRLFIDDNKYSFMRNDSKEFFIDIANKEKSRVLDLGGRPEVESAELQGELINTAVSFINKIKTKANLTDRQISEMFDNDEMRNRILLLAFNDSIDIETAKDLYNTLMNEENGYDKFEKKRIDQNIPLTSNWDVFIWAYEQWNPKVAYRTGNELVVGARDIIKDGLSRYNMKLRDGNSVIEELDDEFVKIYNNSRLEDNPKDKLSSTAKAIISNISMGKNNLGYDKTLPTDQVYAILAEAAVGQPNFQEMLSSLDYIGIWKPEARAITERLQQIPADQQAAIFSAFKNTYKQFLLFKQDSNYDNKIINSNQSDVTLAAIREYTENSEEVFNENPRAVYQVVEGGNLKVKPEKLRRIKNAWSVVETVQAGREWTDQQIESLGTYLWELGMNYGPTLESTQSNLKRYYEVGDESGLVKGTALYKFVFDANNNFKVFLNFLEKTPNINFHTKEGTTVTKIASLNMLFDERPFGTFISGTNKQYYPINLPTALDELVELINDPKQVEKRSEYLKSLEKDELFNPSGGSNLKHRSVLLQLLGKLEVRKRFKNYSLDSYKNYQKDEITDYTDQTPRSSLILRMLGFENKGDTKFSFVTIPIQADRKNLTFIEVPKISDPFKVGLNLSRKDVIEGLIIQDMARMNKAKTDIREAAKRKREEGEESNYAENLVKGYHYKDTYFDYKGSAFEMPQIYGNTNTKVGMMEASDLLEKYLNGTDTAPFQNILNLKVIEVNANLKKYEQEMLDNLETYKIQLVRDVSKKHNSKEKVEKFVSNFIFNDFVMRIELNKLFRGGYLGKDTSDYYKRYGLLNTPGVKLGIRGEFKDSRYGMMPTYNALVIKDFDFIDKERVNQTVNNLINNGLDSEIAEKYRSAKKTDAQSFISIDMYRGIMMGMGRWDMNLDETAYKEYQKGGEFNRPIEPLKPYHEQTDVKNGISYMHMDKNSYTVVTPELAKDYPYLNSMLNVMRKNSIHVVHTESVTKGMHVEPQDFQTTGVLDFSNPMVMESNKLRFPQIIPTESKKDLTFNRQLRKNIITNIDKKGDYNIGGSMMKGFEVQELFYESIAGNINEDTKTILKELGITKLNNIENTETLEHKEAKLEHLIKLRENIQKEIQERDLPQNYLNGLDIVPNGVWDYQFRIPLSFPHYSARYETIVSGMLNKKIYKQKLKGLETVQIAELGGHARSGELRMYDGQNRGAEVRIKASLLGFTAEEIEGKTAADFEGDSRLEFIGFRIPQQGKNSAMVFNVVDFLPENYDKAIMVPGGLTVQQGSDFDIDKLNLILQHIGKLNKRQERDNTIYNIFKGILLDKKHLTEVMTPVDNEDLSLYQVIREKADYNNPNYEIEMERIQKMGIAGRGLWSNMIAGRNVAQTLGTLSIATDYSPYIDGMLFNNIATKDLLNNFTDANISQYLSAAVDAAKDPIQIDINDNKYTIPVAGLMLSVGLPISTVVSFLQHPSIVREITKAQNNNTREDRLLANKFSIDEILNRDTMTTDEIINKTLSEKTALTNFKAFHLAGKQLQRVNKIITPDNLDNVNELSSILSWLEEENYYLYNENSLISGAEDYIKHQQGTPKPLHAANVAYRGIFDTILDTTEQLGFIQNSNSFKQVKRDIKESLGIRTLSKEQHKFIDRALYISIMTQPHSPFKNITNRKTIQALYNPKSSSNLVNKVNELGLKFPRLYSNPFYKLLREDPSNKETNLALIQLQTSIGLSTADKNRLSSGLLALITDNEQEVRTLGKYLVANQILTSGFSPTYGSYIDLIPSEVLTTDILNPGQGSPVEYFKQEKEELINSNYSGFSTFTHQFIRNFGLNRPGGRNLLPEVKGFIALGKHSFTLKDPKVYRDKKYIPYFKTEQQQMYVHLGGGQYQQLSPLGVQNRIYEINTGEVSIFGRNITAENTEQTPVIGMQGYTEDIIDNENNTEVQPEKGCKKK